MRFRFNLQVLSLKGMAFDDMVESVYLDGEDGEFELLAYHHPLVAAIPKGEIKIAGHDSIPIIVGIINFRENRCRIIAQVDPQYKNYKETWDI
ncbi:MAG: hypothetical protein KTQ49_08545 [Candidatus Omnitrophica bacterium]|nr:hypothetical protein [Candidatus Omnitrophota bacterium]